MSEVFRFKQPLADWLTHVTFISIAFVATCIAVANILVIRPITVFPMLCSAGWLAIVFFVCREEILVYGLKEWLIRLLGMFVLHRKLRITPEADKSRSIVYGYSFAGREFQRLKFRVDGLKLISFGPGQASAMRGKDVNDWQGTLEFEPKSAICNMKEYKYGLCFLGPRGRKNTVDRFCRCLYDFLRDNELNLSLPVDATTDQYLAEQGVPPKSDRAGG